ncbi:hypothetical protein A2U01_0068507, partial [Trifolium medium]|nr:hypothetical protein [Trifolium medium]
RLCFEDHGIVGDSPPVVRLALWATSPCGSSVSWA